MIDYVSFSIDPHLINSEQDLDLVIQMKTQGKAVVVEDKFTTPVTMRLVNMLYESTLEIVFVTDKGHFIQIFNNARFPIIRPINFLTGFITCGRKRHNLEKTKNLQIINLDESWTQLSNLSETDRIKNCLNYVSKYLLKADKTVISGNVPTVVFLLVQNLLFGNTKELYYQDPTLKELEKIY